MPRGDCRRRYAADSSGPASGSWNGHELFKFRYRNGEARTHLVRNLAAHKRVAHLGKSFGEFARQLRFCTKRAEIDNGGFAIDPIIEKVARRCDPLFKFFFSITSDERIRILARRHFYHPDDEIVLKQ